MSVSCRSYVSAQRCRSGRRVDELGDDPHPVARPPHAALEQGRDVQRGADLAEALLPLLEPHDRAARDHLERADLRELGDHVLGDAVGEELVLRVGAQVEEREDRDRRQPGAARAPAGAMSASANAAAVGNRSAGSWPAPDKRLLHGRRHRGPQAAHAGDRLGEPLGDHHPAPRRRCTAARPPAARRARRRGCTRRSGHPASRSPAACSGLMYSGVPSMRPVSVSRSPAAATGRERDAEVGDHRLALVEQDVLRLDVAVDHALRAWA